jgi:hypothetical protein
MTFTLRPSRRRLVALVGTLGVGITLLAATSSTAATQHRHHAHHHRVLLVCNHKRQCPHVSGTHYFKSLQLAVDRSRNGDYILVWPGHYKQSTTVARGHGLTHGLHIRGMNRNTVVFNGRKTGGSAVHVIGVNRTHVENMTGEHYHSGAANAFYWTGVDGYWGNYLTAYDNGDYGVYAYDSTSSGKTPSTFAFDYGSWNADSGLYIGGCRDCNAVITNSRAEHNPIGYSGTNAGGELYLINSEWDHNASGIVPNTLTSEPDPPQSGVFIAHNYVHDNNAHNTPGSGITAIAPVGYGIEIAGGSDNIIRNNRISNEKHAGVILHWLFAPPTDNQVVYNKFRKVGWGKDPADADVVFDGTGVMNCADHNVDYSGGHKHPATMAPVDSLNIDKCDDENPGRQQGKGLYGPGDPLASVEVALNAVGVTEPKDYEGPGTHPGAQRSMKNPCKGVPANPWCSAGKPAFHIPSKATHHFGKPKHHKHSHG